MSSGKRMTIRIGRELPIYLMLIGMVVIQIGAPLKSGAAKSFGTWMIFASSALVVVMTGYLGRWKKRYVLIITLLFFSVLLSILCSKDLSYENWVVAFCFMEIPIFWGAYPEIKQTKIRKTIYKYFALLSVYYIVLCFTSLSHIYYTKYGAVQMSYLTLGYNNPNETAMHLFICLVVLSSLLVELKHPLAKGLVGIDIACLVVLLWLTESRTGILVSAAFGAMILLFRNKEIPQIIRIMSIAVPIAFLMISIIFKDLLSSLRVLGELADTGRTEIYGDVLENITPLAFLVGKFGYRFQNLHNGFWSIFATIGILGTVPFLAFVNMKLKEVQSCAKSGVSKCALCGLLCIIIYTATEAAFLVTGSTYAAATISVYLISISGNSSENFCRCEVA